MNAAIRAVVRGAIYNGLEVFGIERGFDGLIAGEIFEMDRKSVSDIIHRGGTVLKTARSTQFMEEQGFRMALNMLESFQIEGLVIIGGNGSLHGALDLVKAGVKVIGLPGTIDNDLPFTDETIGFDTSVNTVLSAVGKIRDTSHSHDRTTVVEVMGRECGDIAIVAGLTGGAEMILIPERTVDMNAVCRTLVENRNNGKMSSIIIKAEGVDITTAELEQTIREKTGLDTKMVILGYVQRGGSPTARDRMLASVMGYEAVRLLISGEYNKAVGFRNNDVVSYDLQEAMQMKKKSLLPLSDISDILSK
jgi:6-phosphofructokinase 1